ncbi:hypothetical protein QBC46DRAFT_323831 [Diplogelasinospora grovesii]|uniref:Uncharacterized protein n=1 Tax=Diplogelasinospora grovesii TaxID=303347 RepID=A0AAN6MY29_9PEZI|nr:hypothetical protein QBC46DRAFT_323831 [Diplogelasinospora grovesii]
MKAQVIVGGIFTLIQVCAAIPPSLLFNRNYMALAARTCDCSDTPCPEANTTCVNGACQCVHHDGCKTSSDCDQYNIPCGGGNIAFCETNDPSWPNNVCVCIPQPVGCDCSNGPSCDHGFLACDVVNLCRCFPVTGCSGSIQGQPVVDCHQVLTHCPDASTPWCYTSDNYTKGVCECMPTACVCTGVDCPDGHLACDTPGGPCYCHH